MADKKPKPYLTNLVLKSDVYNLNSITTEATIENKFQICLSKLNSFETRNIALNDIKSLISLNKTNPKALRHFISSLKIQNKSNISNSSKEAQAMIYGIIAKEFKDNLYDPIDKPPNLIKSIERLLTQLRDGYLPTNTQIQNAVAESYIKILIYCMPKNDISLIILVFFEPLINLINSGANLIFQQGAALVLCKLIEYMGSGMIPNLGENGENISILEIIASNTINNLLKGSPVDNHYAIDALYQLMIYVKFDIFNDRLKDLYTKLINYLKYKEFNYQLKISVLKTFELIADNLLSSDTDKIIGYFQQDILNVLNEKTSDRIHKVQLQAREALNKWKKIEQIFLTEERQKENYILNNEQDENFVIEENNLLNLENIDNNTKNPRIKPLNERNIDLKVNKRAINTLKNNEMLAAEKEDINTLDNFKTNENKYIIDKYKYNNTNNLFNKKTNKELTIELTQNQKNNIINNKINNINKNDPYVNDENSSLISLLKTSLSKVINESVSKNNNCFNNINSKLNTMDERINDLQLKISKINKNRNIKNNLNNFNNILQEENQLHLQMLSNNLMESQQIELKINDIWKEALKLLGKNKISEAYKLIVSSGDDIYLLRLVCLTGPALYLLEEELSKKILIRINMINRGKQIQDILIKLVEESIKMNKNNGCIFFNLNHKEQNDILDSLYRIFKNNKNNALTIKAQTLYSKIIEDSKIRNNNQ